MEPQRWAIPWVRYYLYNEKGSVVITKRKTHEEFVKDVNIKSPNTIVISEYLGRTKKINCKCKVCGHIWSTSAMNLLGGTGCPICGRIKSDLSRRKTHDYFIKELNIINPNITVLDKYELDSKPVRVRCNLCGHEYNVLPSNLLQGRKCKQCSNIKMHNARIKSNEQFLLELKKINQDIQPLEHYKGRAQKILCKCLKHQVVGHITPAKLLQGQTFCQKCALNKFNASTTKTHEQFLQELFQVNPNIEPLENYSGARTGIKVRCKKCGYEWIASPSYLITGNAHCVSCSRSYSEGEEQITNILRKNEIKFIAHKTFENLNGVGNHKLSYDFYLYEYNILIEFQGQYHDGTAGNQTKEQYEIQKNHDQRKKDYAKNNNFLFYEVWYYQDILSEMDKIINNIPVTITA